MGVLADDLNRAEQQRNLGRLRNIALQIQQKRKDDEQIRALQDYLTPRQERTGNVELTPEAEQGRADAREFGEVPVDPKQMPDNFAGGTREAALAPPQTRPEMRTVQPELSEASPEQLSEFGVGSKGIMDFIGGKESARRKAATEASLEEKKGGMEKERALAVEGARGKTDVDVQNLRGQNAIDVENVRSGTRGTFTQKYQVYLQRYGNPEDALKHLINDEKSIKASGRTGGAGDPAKKPEYLGDVIDPKTKQKYHTFGFKGKTPAENRITRIQYPQKQGGSSLTAEKMKLLKEALGIKDKNAPEGAEVESTEASPKYDAARQWLEDNGKKTDDVTVKKFLENNPDFEPEEE